MATVYGQNTQLDTDDVQRKRWIGLSTVCVLMSGCVIGVIWSERFAAFLSMFLCLQHPVDIPFANETLNEIPYIDLDWYRVGPLDIVTMLFYALTALLITTTLEDTVGQKLLRQYNEPRELCHSLIHLAFLVQTVIHAVVAIFMGHFDSWAVWNGYPLTQMPFVSKLFLLYQVSYWTHAAIYHVAFRPQDAMVIPRYTEILFHIVQLFCIPYILGCNLLPLSLYVVLPHSVLGIVKVFALICEKQNASDVLIIALNTIYDYVTVLEHIGMFVTAVLLCMWAEALPVSTKAFVMITCLLWNCVGHLEFYFKLIRDSDVADAGTRPRGRPRRNPYNTRR